VTNHFNIEKSTITASTGKIQIADGDGSEITNFKILDGSAIIAETNITVASGDTATVDSFEIKNSTITAKTGGIDIASGDDSKIETKFEINALTMTAKNDITIAKGDRSKANKEFTIKNSTFNSTAGSLTYAEGDGSMLEVDMEDTDLLAKNNITIADGVGSTGKITVDNSLQKSHRSRKRLS
jgi:hypothetical protein